MATEISMLCCGYVLLSLKNQIFVLPRKGGGDIRNTLGSYPSKASLILAHQNFFWGKKIEMCF